MFDSVDHLSATPLKHRDDLKYVLAKFTPEQQNAMLQSFSNSPPDELLLELMQKDLDVALKMS